MAKKKETISPSSKNETTMGQRIEYLKRENSLNDEQIGNIFTPAAPKSLVYYWLKDKRQPSLARLIIMAQYFDVPLLWLLMGDDTRKSSTLGNATHELVKTELLYHAEPEAGGLVSQGDMKELDLLLTETIHKTVHQWFTDLFAVPEDSE